MVFLVRLILISLPSPEPLPSASAFIKLPFSFDPNVQVVSPLTFLTFNFLSSSLVKSKTFTFSAKTTCKRQNPRYVKINKIFLTHYLVYLLFKKTIFEQYLNILSTNIKS